MGFFKGSVMPPFGRIIVPIIFRAILPIGLGCGISTSARAEFTLCNQTFEMANVAVGQLVDGQFQTRGWWKVGPNQCAAVIRDALKSRYLYVFATDVFGKELLNGSVPMCLGTKRFTIQGQEDCALRGHITARFIEVDTQMSPDWTMFLAAPP